MKIRAMDFSGVEDPHNPGMDYPTAWALQKEVGEVLDHHPRCSSVPGWDPISGPHWLCDCGALRDEWIRRSTEEPTP